MESGTQSAGFEARETPSVEIEGLDILFVGIEDPLEIRSAVVGIRLVAVEIQSVEAAGIRFVESRLVACSYSFPRVVSCSSGFDQTLQGGLYSVSQVVAGLGR